MPIYELLRSKGFDVITVRPTTSVSEAFALLKGYNLEGPALYARRPSYAALSRENSRDVPRVDFPGGAGEDQLEHLSCDEWS